jgi:hypothetical protein
VLMPALTYNDVLSTYANYPAPIRPYLLRAETHPTLRATLTKSYMRIIVDIIARAPIAEPTRPLAFRADVIAADLDVTTKTVSRAVSLLRKLGWLKRHPESDGRNGWGEFCVGQFVLGDELRSMLGLPTAATNQPGAIKNSAPEIPAPDTNAFPELQKKTNQNVPEFQANQTKMSHGLYRVNKVFKKEAPFSKEAFDTKASKTTPKTNPTKVPADLVALQTELGILPFGIFKLMGMAKAVKQRLQDVWVAKRDQILSSGATEGRAVRYLESLLNSGEDFAYRARLQAMSSTTASPIQRSAQAAVEDNHRRHWNICYSGPNNLRVRIDADGSTFVSDATRVNAYVRPADMGQIYEAIAAGKLKPIAEQEQGNYCAADHRLPG